MDGKPVMLVECKWCGTDLDQAEMSQLFRYFAVVEARIGILTNGIIYRFYTDLEEPNKMDKKPFFEVNLLDVQEQSVAELKKLSRSSFNLQEVLSAACDLKYTREIKRILADEMAQPSDDFARFFAERIHSGRITQNVKAQFVEITRKAFRSFLNDQITERLKSAMATPEPPAGEPVAPDAVESEPVPESRVVTTEEELEAFYLVKSILRNVVDPSRITYRDYINACSVLLDENKRKVVVQFVFNERGKQIRFLTEDRTDYDKYPIEDLNDIYKHADRIIAEARKYEAK
ncbi:MAG TPA: type I restriction enzyme HsdR N-terminal domain-containing protein, partial [bacterium]|nr:type I restriction enzyme HsdR N-terminal domain-containing protein [bacterium]